jgi:DNA-binding CsgD family transcriptional regulator
MDRIVRRCAEHDEERALRIALLEDLRQAVPFGAHMWALTDPETGVTSSPLATVPESAMARLPTLIRCRHLTTVNRPAELAAPAESLLRATEGQPEESLLYRELRGGGTALLDIATVVFRDRFGSWGWLDLWREEGDEPFSGPELDLLGAVSPFVTEALRRCLARTFDEPTPPLARSGPAVLVLSPELEVRAQTPETDAYLRTLLPPDADRRPIPAAAYNVAGQLLAVEAGLDDQPPLTRVRLVGGLWLTFRAARVETADRTAAPDIAVSVEPTSPRERQMLYARCHGLTARETELLDLLVGGADTKAVAAGLYISEHTVQDHLKSIFDKTGTRNRRTLLARVTGR